VVVGGDGDPTKRGVVSTANYVARRFGIGSAMPLRTAYKRCPDAVFLPVDADHYLQASVSVMDVLRTFDAVVQVLGWDEAFMGLAVRTQAAAQDLARGVQVRVLERTDLWCSIGVGDTTLRAKLASGFAKPRGVFTLTAENWEEVMGPQGVAALWGIGTKTARRLEALGIRSVSELASADEHGLAATFGPRTGPWLRRLATGEGDTRVSDATHVARGHGRERTFQQDLTDPDEVRSEVSRLVREVLEDLRADGRPVVRVVVKVRFAPFTTKQRSVVIATPSLEPEAIDAAALAALPRFDLDRPIRLLGVRGEFGPVLASAATPRGQLSG
jgi:DNA polymerase-4